MKLIKPIAFALVTTSFAISPILHAGGKHDHDHAKCSHSVETGPNGGRILKKVTPRAEFLVTKDKHIQVTFYDKDNKVITPKISKVSGYIGKLDKVTTVKFEKKENHYLSKTAVKEQAGKEIALVVKANGKKMVDKFVLNLSDCDSCDTQQYACSCNHTH